MTSRDIFENLLIELSKHKAPTLKLYEFNYYCNKAINQIVNKSYNWYDMNQQSSDNLRVLKTDANLIPEKIILNEFASVNNATYEVYLPSDYLHMLNCRCVYYVAKSQNCYKQGSYIEIPATRLTADYWGAIISDVYNRPSPTKPYYYLHNTYDKKEGIRCEIRYGNDDTIFQLKKVLIDYLKTPDPIKLTQEQIDLIEDTSQIIEFPDYMIQEIINELVHFVMEQTSNPRLNNNLQITQSIAHPTQQQQPAQ